MERGRGESAYGVRKVERGEMADLESIRCVLRLFCKHPRLDDGRIRRSDKSSGEIDGCPNPT